MILQMDITNIKGIPSLNFQFPLDNGLYAITGENGAGKSTLISCASTVFYQMPMIEYFGKPQNASILFSLEGASRGWACNAKLWTKKSSKIKMPISGFYEGSIIFGNRFKDKSLSALRSLDNVKEDDLTYASEFVKNNLGLILHDDKDYYSELYILNRDKAIELELSGISYFYKTSNGEYISQARMSTGETLLTSILHSLKRIYDKRHSKKDNRPCIVFLDEIELALHSAALRRLVLFLKEISTELNLAIFFSTHSIELLREIKAQNIYYLQKNIDDSISITNPCYPAYATRNLYSDDGYGNDIVVLVEDDLAKIIVERILVEKSLISNIRIKVLPTGGWTNTITMAYDITSSNLLLKGTKLAVILDRDIKPLVPDFLKTHKQYTGLKFDYLPINSLEKYLRDNLYVKFNNDLYNMLNTYVFQKRPLDVILKNYKRDNNDIDDDNGKTLYGVLLNELRSMRKDRDDLVEIVVKYIMDKEQDNIEELSEYISNKIKE